MANAYAIKQGKNSTLLTHKTFLSTETVLIRFKIGG